MEKIILSANVRQDLGKGAAKQVREKGLVPGVVYKDGNQGANISVDSKAFWKALHTDAGENAIITLDIDGKEEKTVIVQEIQTDPLSDAVVHVDFHEISLKEKIKVNVPVHVKGEARGVKEQGGVLAQLAWELEVECLPTAIPESIVVNVEELEMNESIHVSELPAIEGVTMLADPEDPVVTVQPPKPEEEEEVEGEEEGEESVEPEVIKKGKEEEGEEAAEGGE